MRKSYRFAAAILPLMMVFSVFQIAAAVDPAPPYFSATWARTDMPVAAGQAVRTWMWGPDADTQVLWEQYAQSPDGHRQVQYFDKSRMEITNPDADPNSIWYVTNGLLVVELVTGQMQVGDDQFIPRTPSEANVAGDQGDPNGPAYVTFLNLRGGVNSAVGSLINQRVDRDGDVTTDSSLDSQNILYGAYDDVTMHNIAAPFWNFMNSSGIVYVNGQYVEALLFENPFFATGRPITEAYWANVLVSGQETLVLMQCFERRCMTYTPSNAEQWQVEAGNVGQHYYAWRYSSPPPASAIAFELHYSNGNSDLYTVNPDGSGLTMLTNDDTDMDLWPSWSPDGSQIAFWANRSGSPGIWVMNADGSNTTQIATNAAENATVAWSPNGEQIAYACTGGNLCLVDPDGTNPQTLTELDGATLDNVTWSHDSQMIAYDLAASGEQNAADIWVYNFSDNSFVQITNNPDDNDVHPTWAPNDSMIAFSASTLADGRYAIWTAHPDGTALDQLTNGGDFDGSDQAPVWSTIGNTIAFVRFRTNSDNGAPSGSVGNILKINSDGTGFAELTTNMSDTDEGPSWSPDGNYITFWTTLTGVANIFVMDSDGTGIQQLTSFTSDQGAAMNPVWGP